MKKVLVHLSMLCLLAFLLMPLAGCKKEGDNTEVEEQPATSTEAPATAPAGTEPAMGTTGSMGTESTMGTEGSMGMTGGTGTMGTQGTEPPPAK